MTIPKIVIADDNVPNLELLRAILDGEAELHCAMDGVEAVALVQRHRPRLAILDLQMPVLDGYGALAAIRSASPETKPFLVALTASAMSQDRERALQAGFDAFVTKPVEPVPFRRLVRRWLGVDADAATNPEDKEIWGPSTPKAAD